MNDVAVLPKLDHFRMADFQHFYEPAEDTFLLCDALESDRLFLTALRPLIAMEIGSGSGCVITFLATLLKQQGLLTSNFAIDINPHAALATRKTASSNGV
jgi:release factor glutamine methyltransferase